MLSSCYAYITEKELKKRAYYLFKKGETNDSKKSMAVP